MAVAFAGSCGVVDSAEDVNVFAPGSERREARRDFVIGAFFGGNPVALRNAVAVEPKDKACFDRLFRRGFRSAAVGGAA